MPEPQRILCVDDEENILNALRRLFFDERFDVLTARSAADGIALLAASPPVPLVISDYRMPGMNGVEFLREVNKRWPETVRILLTGYSDMKAVIDAVNDGNIYKFIAKPWNDDELRISVANALERWRLSRQNAELALQLQKANEELTALNDILRERITDEVVALRDRNRTLERHASVLDALPLAVICLDGDGWITYYNRTADEVFGWNGKNMLYVPRDRAFSGTVQGVLEEIRRTGAAVFPNREGRTMLARRMPQAAGDGKGMVLVFEEQYALEPGGPHDGDG